MGLYLVNNRVQPVLDRDNMGFFKDFRFIMACRSRESIDSDENGMRERVRTER
jgi:hypothetical protein